MSNINEDVARVKEKIHQYKSDPFQNYSKQLRYNSKNLPKKGSTWRHRDLLFYCIGRRDRRVEEATLDIELIELFEEEVPPFPMNCRSRFVFRMKLTLRKAPGVSNSFGPFGSPDPYLSKFEESVNCVRIKKVLTTYLGGVGGVGVGRVRIRSMEDQMDHDDPWWFFYPLTAGLL